MVRSPRQFDRSNYRLKRIFRQCAKRKIADGGLVHGCPLNNLAQEMSPLDEKFRQSLERIYVAWRETVAAAFARGIKAGKVRKDVSPRKVAAFIVAVQAGMGRYGQKRPGRGGAVANRPGSFRLFGQFETIALFYESHHTDQSVCSKSACNRTRGNRTS